MKKIIGYYFRSAEFELVKNNNSKSIIVFIHGILSRTYSAFKINDGGNKYFWDLIQNIDPLDEFDIGLFSYGKIDLSYLLELEYPINNLVRISTELHGAIQHYRNVIFISHSQGGLVAKTYSSIYFKKQSPLLITLHTPHRNKSITILRINDDSIWDDDASYLVPHIFCASVNDNKIVKIDNALTGCKDLSYISYDSSKKKLGHSHLSSNPDDELIITIQKQCRDFICSGYNGIHAEINSPDTYQGKKTVKIKHSTSKAKLKSIKNDSDIELKLDDWSNDKYINYLSNNCDEINTILIQNASINFQSRKISYYKKLNLELIDLDKGKPDNTAINEKLCNDCFANSDNEMNPYKKIPFFVSDFPKRTIIANGDFLKIFLEDLDKRNTTNINKTEIYDTYHRSMIKYREKITKLILKNLTVSSQFKPSQLQTILFNFINTRKKHHNKRNSYLDNVDILKRQFYLFENREIKITICDIELILSKLMKSDGDTFWLDKDIKAIFSKKI